MHVVLCIPIREELEVECWLGEIDNRNRHMNRCQQGKHMLMANVMSGIYNWEGFGGCIDCLLKKGVCS